ncbi:hypothetical protein F5Y15DRAFT_107002 [Xylariaceae sp. FL0016]|nr:hypothetical protein F5Y15DRAFT_107002 [Xylariaceae sp. FL0016]
MVSESTRQGQTLISTPKWFIALRVLQIIFSLVVIGLSGWWIHGLYEDELGFSIACCLFTWIIALYAVLSEHMSGCRNIYNTWAVLTLDGLMIIFWLANLGAVAHLRSTFNVDVDATCYDDGSAVNSGQCVVYSKRDTVGVATYAALDMLSVLAGISAIIMVLFAAAFAYVCHLFRLAHSGPESDDPEKFGTATGVGSSSMAISGQNAQAQQALPLLNQQQYHHQQQGTQQAYTQNTTYDHYSQQSSTYAGAYASHQVAQPQHSYSPQATPPPGHPYQQYSMQ